MPTHVEQVVTGPYAHPINNEDTLRATEAVNLRIRAQEIKGLAFTHSTAVSVLNLVVHTLYFVPIEKAPTVLARKGTMPPVRKGTMPPYRTSVEMTEDEAKMADCLVEMLKLGALFDSEDFTSSLFAKEPSLRALGSAWVIEKLNEAFLDGAFAGWGRSEFRAKTGAISVFYKIHQASEIGRYLKRRSTP